MDNVILAFSLTLIAGLATGIGSAMVLLTKNTNKKFLCFSLALSAGVMLYVSFVEIFYKGIDSLSEVYGDKLGNIYAAISFFGGMGLIVLIDKFIPKVEITSENAGSNSELALKRMGVFTALAIAIHNFPEGLATFVSALEDPTMGIAITVAIAIHNIPEGIAVAVPIYYSTNSRKKAFVYSLLSGLTEPIGALLGYFLLIRFIGDTAFGVIFAGVAGMMVHISIAELLPTSKEYGSQKLSVGGMVLGMAIMAISLILFK
ncbi:MAG: zinc transporter ZupT [Clostridia bacterium]